MWAPSMSGHVINEIRQRSMLQFAQASNTIIQPARAGRGDAGIDPAEVTKCLAPCWTGFRTSSLRIPRFESSLLPPSERQPSLIQTSGERPDRELPLLWVGASHPLPKTPPPPKKKKKKRNGRTWRRWWCTYTWTRWVPSWRRVAIWAFGRFDAWLMCFMEPFHGA